MEDGSKTGETPRVKSEYAALKRLFQDSKDLSADLKPLRKDADGKIDKKALNDEYTRERKEAVQVKNSQIYSKTTNQIHRYFYIASSKAMKRMPRCAFAHLMALDIFNSGVAGGILTRME